LTESKVSAIRTCCC